MHHTQPLASHTHHKQQVALQTPICNAITYTTPSDLHHTHHTQQLASHTPHTTTCITHTTHNNLHYIHHNISQVTYHNTLLEKHHTCVCHKHYNVTRISNKRLSPDLRGPRHMTHVNLNDDKVWNWLHYTRCVMCNTQATQCITQATQCITLEAQGREQGREPKGESPRERGIDGMHDIQSSHGIHNVQS